MFSSNPFYLLFIRHFLNIFLLTYVSNLSVLFFLNRTNLLLKTIQHFSTFLLINQSCNNEIAFLYHLFLAFTLENKRDKFQIRYNYFRRNFLTCSLTKLVLLVGLLYLLHLDNVPKFKGILTKRKAFSSLKIIYKLTANNFTSCIGSFLFVLRF